MCLRIEMQRAGKRQRVLGTVSQDAYRLISDELRELAIHTFSLQGTLEGT